MTPPLPGGKLTEAGFTVLLAIFAVQQARAGNWPMAALFGVCMLVGLYLLIWGLPDDAA